jgi:uncharacterized membrane protein
MSHQKPQHKQQEAHDLFEDRKQFQVERIILFSDAVFAIAITLLVIEIKLPTFPGKTGSISYHEFVEGLQEKIGEVLGFVLSFAVIGQFWTNHHRLFGFVNGYDNKLLWLNLHMLLWIALMPFSTHLNMTYGNLPLIWFLYSLNMFFIALSLLFIWMYIGKKPHLCSMSHNKPLIKHSKIRALSVSLIFLTGGLLAFLPGKFFMWVSHLFFVLIFPVLAMITRYYNKRYHIKVTS